MRLLAPLPGCGFGMVANPGWLAIARTPRATILARLRRARGQPGGSTSDHGFFSFKAPGVEEASPEGTEATPGFFSSTPPACKRPAPEGAQATPVFFRSTP